MDEKLGRLHFTIRLAPVIPWPISHAGVCAGIAYRNNKLPNHLMEQPNAIHWELGACFREVDDAVRVRVANGPVNT